MRNDVSYLLVSFLSKDIFDIVFLDYINEQMSWFTSLICVAFSLVDEQSAFTIKQFLMEKGTGSSNIDLSNLSLMLVFGGVT